MNFDPLPQLQSPPKPAEQVVENLIRKAEDYSRHEPSKALAVAFGAGVLLNILPTRFIVGSVAAISTLVLKPTLMTLGVVKGFELYLAQTKTKPSHERTI